MVRLLRLLTLFAVAVWLSGVAPLVAQVASQGVSAMVAGEWDEPCGDCPEDDDGEGEKCPPSCADCLCGVARLVVSVAQPLMLAPPMPFLVFESVIDDELAPARGSPPASLFRPPIA